MCKKRCNIWLIWIIYEYDTVCINHEHDTFCINHEFVIIQHAYFIVSLQTLNSAWKERYKVIKVFLIFNFKRKSRLCLCIFSKRILNQQSNALNLNEITYMNKFTCKIQKLLKTFQVPFTILLTAGLNTPLSDLQLKFYREINSTPSS